ncbi:MAG: hypothetical protein ACYTJ0_05095 [Planctomycetota bacterium]
MSDVLCDFCRREWKEDVPMLEGHHGSCVCGRCLTVAYTEVVLGGGGSRAPYACPMCLEGPDDRAALGRSDEVGWPGPVDDGKALCRRCIELAARTLDRDRDSAWSLPEPG